jgi:hypothetical protein
VVVISVCHDKLTLLFWRWRRHFPSKMLVNMYQTTRRHILDGGALLTITDVQNKEFGSHFCQFSWKKCCRSWTLKPIWTYKIQLWGTAFSSNIEILQRFQSKTLRSILNAPWYINNHRVHNGLQMNTVLGEIKKWNTKYLRKSENHTNALAANLLDSSETTRRLKRYTVLTLPDRPE